MMRPVCIWIFASMLLLPGAALQAQDTDGTPVATDLLQREETGFGGLCGIVVDHRTGAVLVNLSDRGMFRSDDQGRSWKRISDTQPAGRTETPGCWLRDPTGKTNRMEYDPQHDTLYLMKMGSDPYRWACAGKSPAPTPGVTIDKARLARLKAIKMPTFDTPLHFDTPEADAILAALEVFPPDNPWNVPVDTWPLHPNSPAMIAAIGGDKPLRYNPDMAFVLVPAGQKKVDVKLTAYSGESDAGPYPVPDNATIEGWPANFKRGDATLRALTLDDVQRGQPNLDADRHGIVVDPVNRRLYEFYRLTKTDAGWTAEQASVFDLASNRLRPDGWTSSDAAGLPIFPSVVRYDELKRGKIEHALRVTFSRTRRAYTYPATHFASRSNDEILPRMGERLRLRKDFDTSQFSAETRTILEALKRYGMLTADNGIDWAVSVAPDERIPVLHEELRKVKGSDFEVVTPPPGYTPAK